MQLIIFDIAGPFIPNGDIPFFQKLSEKSGVSVMEIEERITAFMYPSECGKETQLEFISRFLKDIGLVDEDPQEWLKLRMSYSVENPGIRDFLLALKKKGYKVACAANNSKSEWEHNNGKIAYADLFDYCLTSYMVGARKTSPVIFEKILSHFGIDASEAVFLDDGEKNLVAPAGLGMHVIHYTSVEDAKERLKELGVRV